MWQSLKLQVRDVVELLLLPALAAVLPWRLCFRVFGWLARWNGLYWDATQRSVEHARSMGWLGADATEWARRRRLVTLIDHADFFLVYTRSSQWLKRYVTVQGQWPTANKAAILCTFHWGANMWAMRHMYQNGMHAHLLHGSLDKVHFKGRPVLHAYLKARAAGGDRELGRTRLNIGTKLRSVLLKIIADQEQIIGAIDVPADAYRGKQEVTVLGKKGEVPNGLMRLAVEHQVPVALYYTAINFETGQRTLVIKNLGVLTSVDEFAEKAFSELDQMIRDSPPTWHLWSEVPRFFKSPEV
jgi:phosphatidylinositol dimannoside acyltransferase